MPRDETRAPRGSRQLIGLAASAGVVGVVLSLPAWGASASGWSGLVVVAGLVLVASGLAKLRDPEPTASALSRSGIALPRGSVRLVGLGEVALGAAATLVGSTVVAALVAAAFAVFAAVALRMSRVDGLASCGCFGAGGARPGVVHVVVVAGLAVAAGGAAATGSGGAASIVADEAWWALPALVASALAAWALVTLLTTAAEVGALVSGTSSADRTFRLVEDA